MSLIFEQNEAEVRYTVPCHEICLNTHFYSKFSYELASFSNFECTLSLFGKNEGKHIAILLFFVQIVLFLKKNVLSFSSEPRQFLKVP